MQPLHTNFEAEPNDQPASAKLGQASATHARNPVAHARKQQGVVLFFTLIALLTMSLAAVALIRSVDTSSMITANLAFKQAATVSADAGIETARNMLVATRDSIDPTLKIETEGTHQFNKTDLAALRGYFATYSTSIDPTSDGAWVGLNYQDVNGGAEDLSGNKLQIMIQRMCRVPDVGLLRADCLLAALPEATGEDNVKSAPEFCDKTVMDCSENGQPAMMRVTIRSRGPNNTVSYVQGFIY